MKTRYSIFAVTVAVLLSSCVTQKKCAERFPCSGSDSTVTIVTEKVRDTVFIISPDSSMIQAYIECYDENGKLTTDKARLVQLLAYKGGDRVQPPKVVIRDNVLTAECKTDTAKVYAVLRDKLIKEVSKKVVVVKENYLTGWQYFQLWLGRIFAGLITLLIIWVILKFAVKVNIPFIK